MEIHPIIDPYAIHYDSFAGDVYTIDTASITLTGGTLTAAGLTTAGTITDGTLSIASGSITSAVNGTFSGTGIFGNITIFNPTPILVFKDSTYVGDTSLGYIEWRDSNNTRLGFFGNASSSNDDLYWKNESSGGHIKIETTGAGEFQIFANTYITDRLGIGTTTYTERLNLTDTTGDAATKMQTGVTGFNFPTLPGSASEGTITDNGYPWNNPTNITTDVSTSADCPVDSDISDDLRAYNFGFHTGEFTEVPADATIVGIEVTISRKASDAEAVRDYSIKLVDGDGNVVGDNKADVGTLWPDSQTEAQYGGVADMWGTSLTATDIRDSDFGVDIEIETATEDQNETGYVYWVKIQIYYTRVTYYTAGIDETDLSYKIAYNSALGGTDRFTINPAGDFDFQTGILQTGNAIYFTQTDGAERIDSLADGYVDYFAGIAHRFGDGTNQTEISASGDLTFVESAGLAFGCLSGIDETVACTVQNTWYQVTFDTAGPVNNVEADTTNNELEVTYEGIYQVGITACFHSNPAADFELMVKKTDGTVDLEPHLFQTTAVANKVENTAGYCLIDINANDRVELWVRCTSGTTSAIFDHVSLTITQIGGT